MPTTLRLAWRNLGRNARRTLITALALALSTALCIAYYGLVDGMNAQMVRALTRLDLGHVQVHDRDYPGKRSLTSTIEDPQRVMAKARSQHGVVAVSARAYAPALVSAGSRSVGVQLVGVDPKREPQVTELHRHMASGKYLDLEPTPWPKGRALTADERELDQELTNAAEASALEEIEALEGVDEAGEPDAPEAGDAALLTAEQRQAASRLAAAMAPRPDHPPGVILGKSLAKVLGLKVGDTAYVSTQRTDGAAEGIFVKVRGIFKTGTPLFDRSRVYVHLADLDRLVDLHGEVHEVALQVMHADAASEVAAALSKSLATDRLSVRGWSTIRPDIVRMLRLNRVSTAILSIIIFFVATLGVVNTMLMAVFERTRELGMLRAIGMSARRVFALIVAETLLMAVAAGAVGTGIGLLADWHLVVNGVDLSSIIAEGFTWSGVGFQPVFYGAITAEGVLVPALILCFVSLLASLYPAARAARMQPAVGMRET